MSSKEILNWKVYILRVSDDSLYTGITTDIKRRWHEHCNTKKGAKYFRGKTPQEVVFLESGHDRSTASKREAEIKKLSRKEKLTLIDKAESNKDYLVNITNDLV